MSTTIDYAAPPTCARFMKSESFGRLIAGPIGSGKTTACMFELLRRACEQEKASDGYRYTRFAIVRQTLSQLKMTVLKDIQSWLKSIADYRVSENTIYIQVGDVRSEWVLIPLDDPKDKARLLSSQLTGAWMSECIEMDVALVSDISGRCGRYPSASLGGSSWSGVIADTNMPVEGSEWWKLMETDTPPDWQIFIQPGGLTEDAENLQWLNQTVDTLKLEQADPIRIAQGRKYYERAARNSNPDFVQRYVNAEYGADPSGTAVFNKTFIRKFHVVPSVMPVPGHTLIVGLDYGRDPCAVICQVDHRGRLLVLEEVIAEDIGLELQLREKLRPALMQERYLGMPVVVVGDPAGRAKSTIYEETSFDVVKRAGFNAYPAPTNDIDKRIGAVESFLLGQIDGGPNCPIDAARCPKLVQALNGGYRYVKSRNGQRRPTPDKNEFSHVMDAFQYACLAAHGGMVEMLGRRFASRGQARRVPNFTASAWT